MPTITSTPVTAPASSSTGSSVGNVANTTLASNFQTFLTLLTTQLKNQSPLDPLDTNQFTQQLVQFAQVEQQLKQNEQLSALVSLEKSAQTTTAIAYIGQSVVVDGSSSQLKNSSAQWSLTSAKPASATLTITDSTGQTVYSANATLNAGQQNFNWDGRGMNGGKWADGTYKLSISAKDSAGQPVDVKTEATGIVESVDVTQTPPQLTINGQNFTLDKIKRVIARS